ncbi:MAG: hypothetical protein PHQ89_01085 [Bacilli bacterium]|nr:hypothetical protein [Bacilli bacterium]
MRKVFLLILISIFITGCSIKEINNNSIDKTIDTILYKETNLSNLSVGGYKYYLPRGVRVLDNNTYNNKLYYEGNIYYLYIDVISYSYQKQSAYKINKKAYYSLDLKHNNNKGYLEINKVNNKYFIEMMYNYAKIETYVNKKDIPDTIINISYILSSIKYNDNVIKILFDSNVLSYTEEKFQIFEPKSNSGNFLDYVKEYDTYDSSKDDSDVISSYEESEE